MSTALTGEFTREPMECLKVSDMRLQRCRIAPLFVLHKFAFVVLLLQKHVRQTTLVLRACHACQPDGKLRAFLLPPFLDRQRKQERDGLRIRTISVQLWAS